VRVTQLTDTLTQLTRLRAVNCFLLAEGDGLTLIDANLGGSAEDILAAAAAIGKPITRVALTHAHDDHVGSLDAVMEQLPGVDLLVASREERLRQGDNTNEPGEKSGNGFGTFTKSRTPATRTFAAGERIGSLEVFATPGHTPGHVSFLDTRDRSLIAGDAFKTLGGFAHTGRIHPGFPLPGFASWDRATAKESARALAALKPTLMVVGHGNAARDPADAMARAVG
jgi:glyoxylase-like metal-dependent hydrolase (beta-lactamase superfamily II)